MTLTVQAAKQRSTQIASFPATCEDSGSSYISISPNGNWLASSCDKQYPTIEILDHQGRQWVLQFKDFLAEESFRPGDPPEGWLYPIQWTNDDYLYFTSSIFVDGGGTCFYGFGVQGLYRINLKNGEISTTLPPLPSGKGYLIAFSPDGLQLAYSAEQPTILDLNTGKNNPIETKDNNIGDFTWSPDGTKLAFATCQLAQDSSNIQKSSIQIYYPDSHISKTILEVAGDFLRIEMRDENAFLEIVDNNIQNRDTTHLFFDWATEQFIAPTNTPVP